MKNYVDQGRVLSTKAANCKGQYPLRSVSHNSYHAKAEHEAENES